MDQISSQTSPASFEQKCIYNQPGDPEKAGIIFPASNEFDWAWFPWTSEPISDTSFQSLKRLFENVQYVLGSMYDAQMYQAIEQKIKGSSYLIFGSNIVDVTTFVPEERTKNRESFLREAAKYLAPQHTSLRFQQTTNAQMPHGTEDFLISDQGAIQVLSSYPPK